MQLGALISLISDIGSGDTKGSGPMAEGAAGPPSQRMLGKAVQRGRRHFAVTPTEAGRESSFHARSSLVFIHKHLGSLYKGFGVGAGGAGSLSSTCTPQTPTRESGMRVTGPTTRKNARPLEFSGP